jgi:hypothetical protein
MERCATGILVVGDVLEHCLVVGCVLRVVRLQVCLIAGILPLQENQPNVTRFNVYNRA